MIGPIRYCIRDDYIENPAVSTMDHISGEKYWNESRISSASHFQYHVYAYISELAGRIDARSLVDIGCGPARKLATLHARLPYLEITGIDQGGAVRWCREHLDFGSWIEDDFEAPSGVTLPSEADIVVCADVIEHVRDPDRLLDYVRSVSGRHTHIVLSTPERDRMRGPECVRSPNPQHVREWNASELNAYLVSRGFVIREHRLLPSYKPHLNRTFVGREVRRIIRGRPRNDNQMVVMRLFSEKD